MVRYLFYISYIGTRYIGVQKVLNVPGQTIQGVIENGLRSLGAVNDITTFFSSRTDKGVHAFMNTFHVDLVHKYPDFVFHTNHLKMRLNEFFAIGNHEIIVTNVVTVPDTFHARFCAKSRSYYYRLAILKPELLLSKKREITWLPHLPICEFHKCHVILADLDTSLVKRVTDMFLGTHNFATFAKYLSREPWRYPVKTMQESCFYESQPVGHVADPQYSNISLWEFHFKSRSFLYHQIRKMVGTALAVGLGKIDIPQVEFMLQNPDASNWRKCSLPSPGGLYLANIEYDQKDLSLNNEENFTEEMQSKD